MSQETRGLERKENDEEEESPQTGKKTGVSGSWEQSQSTLPGEVPAPWLPPGRWSDLRRDGCVEHRRTRAHRPQVSYLAKEATPFNVRKARMPPESKFLAVDTGKQEAINVDQDNAPSPQMFCGQCRWVKKGTQPKNDHVATKVPYSLIPPKPVFPSAWNRSLSSAGP